MANHKQLTKWFIISAAAVVVIFLLAYQIILKTNGRNNLTRINASAELPVVRFDKKKSTLDKQGYNSSKQEYPIGANKQVKLSQSFERDSKHNLKSFGERNLTEDDNYEEDLSQEYVPDEDIAEESFEDALVQQQIQKELLEVALLEEEFNDQKLYEEDDSIELSEEEVAALEIASQEEIDDVSIDDEEVNIETELQNDYEEWENTYYR